MIELLVTCLILSGSIFQTPEGWTVESVGASGLRNTCVGITCYSVVVHPIETTYVRLRRTVKIGESVKPPESCQIEVRAKGGADG